MCRMSFAQWRRDTEELPAPGGPVRGLYVRAAKAFKAGERGNDKDGKDVNGRVMGAIVQNMSDSQMRALAEYVAGLR